MTDNLITLLSVFILIFTCGMVLSWGWKFGMWIDNWATTKGKKYPIACMVVGVVLILIAAWSIQ